MYNPDELSWAPLEMFCRLSPNKLNPGDFMWMGLGFSLVNDITGHRTKEERKVHLYKHCDTRRYLNLDAGGHTYEYTGQSHWYRQTTPLLAIANLELEGF